MELFFGMELSDNVINCLKESDPNQFGFHQNSAETIDDIINNIKERCLAGQVYIAYENDVILFLTDQTPYVLRMDSIKGSKASAFDFVKAVRHLISLLENKTEIHKLETRTPYAQLQKLAKRAKWDLEGIHKQSYQMPDGSFADEYSFGYILNKDKKENK